MPIFLGQKNSLIVSSRKTCNFGDFRDFCDFRGFDTLTLTHFGGLFLNTYGLKTFFPLLLLLPKQNKKLLDRHYYLEVFSRQKHKKSWSCYVCSYSLPPFYAGSLKSSIFSNLNRLQLSICLDILGSGLSSSDRVYLKLF